MVIPRILNAGESASWVDSYTDYPASEGWTLKYSLTNASHVAEWTASPLGDDYQVNLTTLVTDSWVAGVYTLIGYVEKEDQRVKVHQSTFEVLPAFTEAADRRSQEDRTLAAINDLLEGKATDDQQMIQYAGRALSRYTFEQLEMIRSRLARTVARKRARRLGHSGRIGATLR